MTEYLRMSGIYWGITVMDLMKHLDLMDKQDIIDFVVSCQHDCGGLGASVNHDPHLLYTLSAIQVCILFCLLSLTFLPSYYYKGQNQSKCWYTSQSLSIALKSQTLSNLTCSKYIYR